MGQDFELRQIRIEAVARALDKAEQYRLLNEPVQAESICRDVLRVDPANQRALVTVILALTDQFSRQDGLPRVQTARGYVAQLTDEYERLYYSGLICERQARALRARGMEANFAYDALRDAMDFYERAERLAPPGNDDAILRWNSCVRTIRRENLQPRAAGPEEPLLLE